VYGVSSQTGQVCGDVETDGEQQLYLLPQLTVLRLC